MTALQIAVQSNVNPPKESSPDLNTFNEDIRKIIEKIDV
jgi:hypothetical protein